MKRFLFILAGLLIFAVGLGIGREQTKEVAYKQGYAEGLKYGSATRCIATSSGNPVTDVLRSFDENEAKKKP